ncbi:hypothetical protein BH23ACI1_BH23ACI1_33030 [soil metagenome]
MPANERAVADVAAAILDGTPIDWPAAQVGATDEERRLLEELRLLCAVADVHRELAPPSGQPAGDSEHAQYWGRLRLIERVGGGTFGEVYRAWDPRLHREVALKLIPVSDGGTRTRSASIIREGRLLARVRHPGVVTIYDAEQIETVVGLCMEFVEGPTLEQRLTDTGVYTAAETINIGVQLCDALSAAHDAGILHRDVKAANVVARADGRVVLMDFGAGRQLDDTLATALTGTPLCVAPEVLQGQEATVRSDVYSLGVLLHRLLTGSYPVQARSLPELRLAHARRITGDPDGGAAPGAGIPRRLAAILARGLDPHPERRYESAAALAAELRAVEGERSAHRRAIALAAAALIVAAVAAGWLQAARGWDWFGPGADGAVAAARDPVRIAIMPFAVTGGDADSDVLREGMARDLIARLQTYDDARVVSTASVFSADLLNLPLAELGARLGVSAVLTGSIARTGGTVAVEARLIGLPDEHDLWRDDYTRPASELLDLPRAIALGVADRLQLRHEGAVQGWPTRSLEAHALYVRGQTALDRFSREGTKLALQLFEQALERDPDYAQAHAALAHVYLQMNPAIPNLSGEDALRLATEATARALSLDRSLPEAHVAAAGVKSARGEWDGAERDYQRAIELGPSNVLTRQQYAHWLSLLGRFDEAVEQARMAEVLDPLSPRAAIGVASALRFGRRFEEAIVQARKVLDLDPDHLTAYLNLGHNYQGLGRLDEAIEAFQRHRPGGSGNLGHAYALAGRTDEARALAGQLEQAYAKTGLGAGEIAQIYSGLGEIDRAFEWLGMDRFSAGWPTTFKVAPVWDPLRSDPRFTALLKKYGLAD